MQLHDIKQIPIVDYLAQAGFEAKLISVQAMKHPKLFQYLTRRSPINLLAWRTLYPEVQAGSIMLNSLTLLPKRIPSFIPTL